MAFLSSCLDSLNFSLQFPQVKLLLDRAYVTKRSGGDCKIMVLGLQGNVSFNELAWRVNEGFQRHIHFGYPTLEDRANCIKIIRRLEIIHAEMQKGELPLIWRRAGEVVLKYCKMIHEEQFVQLFGGKINSHGNYEHSDGMEVFNGPLGEERWVSTIESSIIGKVILLSNMSCRIEERVEKI